MVIETLPLHTLRSLVMVAVIWEWWMVNVELWSWIAVVNGGSRWLSVLGEWWWWLWFVWVCVHLSPGWSWISASNHQQLPSSSTSAWPAPRSCCWTSSICHRYLGFCLITQRWGETAHSNVLIIIMGPCGVKNQDSGFRMRNMKERIDDANTRQNILPKWWTSRLKLNVKRSWQESPALHSQISIEAAASTPTPIQLPISLQNSDS